MVNFWHIDHFSHTYTTLYHKDFFIVFIHKKPAYFISCDSDSLSNNYIKALTSNSFPMGM